MLYNVEIKVRPWLATIEADDEDKAKEIAEGLYAQDKGETDSISEINSEETDEEGAWTEINNEDDIDDYDEEDE